MCRPVLGFAALVDGRGTVIDIDASTDLWELLRISLAQTLVIGSATTCVALLDIELKNIALKVAALRVVSYLVLLVVDGGFRSSTTDTHLRIGFGALREVCKIGVAVTSTSHAGGEVHVVGVLEAGGASCARVTQRWRLGVYTLDS